MAEGADGSRESDTLLETDPPQEFTAVTDKVPEMNDVGILRVIELPLLETKVQPLGTIQLWLMAPATGFTEYVNCPPPHRFPICPVITPNVDGFLLIVTVRGKL